MSTRREEFVAWLIRAWEFAQETDRPIQKSLAELVAHSDEPDYPLWHQAQQMGVIGDTRIARVLRRACGMPHETAQPTDWERQINYSPIIQLESKLFEDIYSRLGWVNRYTDTSNHNRNFWLWSPAGNVVRFVVRPQMDQV